MTTLRQVDAAARRLAELLEARQLKIVFAESCTGGLVSASLTRIPGISEWLCGSAVVYQVETKAGWLGIPRAVLSDPGPVSRRVASQMAENVLAKTPQADVAVSVTGHLGPDAPQRQDGLLYVAVAVRRRTSRTIQRSDSPKLLVKRHRLAGKPGGSRLSARRTLRGQRQRAAAQFVLQTACAVLVDAAKTT